ncbi:MAG TPA: 2-amino-4-hydroxy-6-hydroxymethyldihydropteridine diphosphokinase, partial [Candidatus Peregrinibacteria bacterium]|nr:2-amino-4-hydroxy-6-hydroxymethyldihydropteridine diphosphokinase [Candidatus Peregrinibacteria bacterium]
MANKIYIALGSNIESREDFLEKALEKLKEKKIKVVKKSFLYETEPVGEEEQAWFLNQVVEVETSFNPEELLIELQKIEKDLGRVEGKRNGPRKIDLDILFFGDLVVDLPHLKIPHLRLAERKFILEPLNE